MLSLRGLESGLLSLRVSDYCLGLRIPSATPNLLSLRDFSTHEGAFTSLLNLAPVWSISWVENLLTCSDFTQEIVDAHEGALLQEHDEGEN